MLALGRRMLPMPDAPALTCSWARAMSAMDYGAFDGALTTERLWQGRLTLACGFMTCRRAMWYTLAYVCIAAASHHTNTLRRRDRPPCGHSRTRMT